MEISAKVQWIMDHMGWKQHHVADELGVTQPSVNRWLAGADPRGSTRDRINALYDRLTAGAADAINDDPFTKKVPLVSWVSAGNLKRQEGVTAADIERYVPVANLGRGDWIALTVNGDSMNRIAPEDSVIVVNRADDALINDRFYVFALETGEATFKKFRRDPQPMLQPYSTNLDHLSTSLETDEFYVIGRVRRVITDV